MKLKIKCSCGCKEPLFFCEHDIDSLEIALKGSSIEIKEKEAIKIINFLTKWIDQQRIMNNEKCLYAERNGKLLRLTDEAKRGFEDIEKSLSRE